VKLTKVNARVQSPQYDLVAGCLLEYRQNSTVPGDCITRDEFSYVSPQFFIFH
jgi:hypothetical protein